MNRARAPPLFGRRGEVNPRYHPTGGRFYVKPYPKSKRARRLRLDPLLVSAVCAHVAAHDVEPGGLLFLDLFGTRAGHRPGRC